MKKLYKFSWDIGVTGLFIVEENDVKEAIGKHVVFGDILGKHSDVSGIIDDGEIEEIQVSEQTIKELEDVFGSNISGYNPLVYMDRECVFCGEAFSLEFSDGYKNENNEDVCDDCAKKIDTKNLIKIDVRT